MLRWNIRDLRGGPVATEGVLEPDDPALGGLQVALTAPVAVDGVLQSTDDGDFLWRGHLHAQAGAECRRCLGGVTIDIDDDVDVLFSADPELADDPSVYPLTPPGTVVDVTPAVREELALRLPAFPLCRPECRGLCATCGADLNAGPCQCAAGTNS